ncbi:MAG TPA: helix-turn-helix domain-containing protein [Candidatus Cybelea sp.]
MEDGRIRGSSEFGALLRRFRLKAGLSQESLAERARMSANGIGALERGYRRSPQHETLQLLAGALALSEDERRTFEAAAARSAPAHRLGGGSNVTVGPWVSPATTSALLQLALTSFVGRKTELEEIAALVHEHRLVTLTGPGGIGKTQTALHVAGYVDGEGGTVRFAPVAEANNAGAMLAAVAAAFGVQESPHRPLHESLFGYLRDRSVLLVLDNCEHLIADAAHLAATLLTGCPGLRILATSREPLHLAGERVYVVPSLKIDAAVELFSDRARAIDHRFALTPQNEPIVAEVCRRLDGIPLAIELAAARVKVLPPRELAHKLDERFRVLTGGDRSALPRHQTMRALIDWSYDLLTPEERALFRRLSIFAGGFTLEVAAGICGEAERDEIDVLGLLSSLVDKSLVHIDPSKDDRFRFLESTRHYAREKLVGAGEYDAVARAHALAFVALAEELDANFDLTPDADWFAQAEPEMDNWRAALDWTLGAQGDFELGRRLAGRPRPVWQLFAAEGRRWIEMALATADETTPPSHVARLYVSEAFCDAALGLHKACLASAHRALDLYQSLGDARGIAAAQRWLGRALVFLGRRDEGEKLLDAALLGFRATGQHKAVGVALQDLGIARQHDVAASRAFNAAALTVFRESGAERSAANTAINLAELEFRVGDAETALRLSLEALAFHRVRNAARRVAQDLANITAYCIALQRWDEAITYANEALSLASSNSLDVVVTWVLLHLAAIDALAPMRDRERAARLLGYIDAQLAALEAPLEYTERQNYDRANAGLIESLGAERVAELHNEGGHWTGEDAVAAVTAR